MHSQILLVLVLPFCFSNPLHSIEKRGLIEDIFFSENWRDLYNYYKEHCNVEHPNKVMKWSIECVNVCDENGDPLFLDRRGNPYDIGLGSFELAHGPGEIRSPSDDTLYLGDPCPENIEPESVIQFNYENERKDPYVIVCNETRQAEFLSLRYSRCPNGVDKEVPVKPLTDKVEGGDCIDSYNNSTLIKLSHNDYRSTVLSGIDYQLCWFHYCCDGILYTLTGSCSLSDFCTRVRGA